MPLCILATERLCMLVSGVEAVTYTYCKGP